MKREGENVECKCGGVPCSQEGWAKLSGSPGAQDDPGRNPVSPRRESVLLSLPYAISGMASHELRLEFHNSAARALVSSTP